MSHNSTIGSPAKSLVNGKVLAEILKDVELQGYQLCIVDLTCGPSSAVPALKMCYSRYCSWFADIGPAFKLNMEFSHKVLGGFCISRNGPLLEGLDYCCE